MLIPTSLQIALINLPMFLFLSPSPVPCSC
jgi:hypothetical protein